MEHSAAEFCDQHGIYLDLVPSEAHWKLGICERSIESVKYILERVVVDDPNISTPDALAEAMRVLNHRETVRGFSPYQYVLERAPDEYGRFFSPVEAPGLEQSPLNDVAVLEAAQQHSSPICGKGISGLAGTRPTLKSNAF